MNHFIFPVSYNIIACTLKRYYLLKVYLLITGLLIFSALLKAQSTGITIGPNGYVASLQVDPVLYEEIVTSNTTNLRDKLKDLSNDVYSRFQDDFDFLIYLFNEDNIRPAASFYGVNYGISNAVTGLGLSIYDNSAEFGSSGKLKNVIVLAAREFIFYGPFLHEVCHTWANFGIPTSSSGHWGFTGGSTKGQLGGFQQNTLQTNIDGFSSRYRVGAFFENANGGNSVPYNKLEQYLMGLISVFEVPEFDVFSTNLIILSSSSSETTFHASVRTRYNADKLQEVLGVRNPSSINSQKDFRTLFVLLTPTPVTTDQWFIVEHHANLMGITGNDGTNFYNFWEATEGLATMQTGNLHNAVLPVTFGAIMASVKGGLLKVDWSTLSEENNDRFIIEASADGKNFTEIGTLKSTAKDGNSDIPVHYTFSLNTNSLGIAGMAGFGLFALLCFAARRNRRLFAVAAFICAATFVSCNKATEELNVSSEGNIYIRIAQVDKDRTKTYSKVIKAVKE